LASVRTINGASALRDIGESICATTSKPPSAEREVQHSDTAACPGAYEPPPQSSKVRARSCEIDQLIDVVGLAGRIIVDVIPKAQPTIPRIADAALEMNAKVLTVEIELVRSMELGRVYLAPLCEGYDRRRSNEVRWLWVVVSASSAALTANTHHEPMLMLQTPNRIVTGKGGATVTTLNTANVRDLNPEEIDLVTAGMTAQVGPISVWLHHGNLGIEIGPVGFWFGNSGAGGHVGSLNGEIA